MQTIASTQQYNFEKVETLPNNHFKTKSKFSLSKFHSTICFSVTIFLIFNF